MTDSSENASHKYILHSLVFTLTNCLLRKVPWRRFPVYFLAQFLGGFIGSDIIYVNYTSFNVAATCVEFHQHPKPQVRSSARIQVDLTKASRSFSEFIASSILMPVIFTLKDDSNERQFSASGSWFPLALFFLIFGLGGLFWLEYGLW